jgi:hypothetical protein
MHDWIKCLTAAGIGGTIAFASTASFAQGVGAQGDPYRYGVGTYEPYAGGYYGVAGPQWQYHGGPRSTSTTDMYYPGWSSDFYWSEGPNPGETIGPR